MGKKRVKDEKMELLWEEIFNKFSKAMADFFILGEFGVLKDMLSCLEGRVEKLEERLKRLEEKVEGHGQA